MSEFGYYNVDCMIAMPKFPDKYFNLSIVDPPYGINYNRVGTRYSSGSGGKNFKSDIKYEKHEWDKVRPNKEYFVELRRVSKNQIIFGGNYFEMPISRGWIFWDKKIANATTKNYGAGELAWTSFDRVIEKFTYDWIGFGYLNSTEKNTRIHPTQKPVALYRWILSNYANHGDLILDTHVGSASSLIACEQLGFSYVGFEIDKKYFEASTQRLVQRRELLRQQSFDI